MNRRAFLAATSFLVAARAVEAAPKPKVGPKLTTPKQRLVDDLHLYVHSANGNDANNGWTPQTAKRTPQNAYDYAKSEFDFNGHGLEIHLAESGIKYAPIKVVSSLVGYHIFNIVGDGPSPNSAMIQAPDNVHCVDVQDYAAVGLLNVGLIGGVNSCGINARQFALVDYGNVAFWGVGDSHIRLDSHSKASAVGPELIFGGAAVHWSLSDNSSLHASGTVTVDSALAWTYFLFAQGASNFVGGGNLGFSGAGAGNASTGKKYLVQLNATARIGAHNFPGNVAGEATLGGVVS